jgi:hypothetical protein
MLSLGRLGAGLTNKSFLQPVAERAPIFGAVKKFAKAPSALNVPDPSFPVGIGIALCKNEFSRGRKNSLRNGTACRELLTLDRKPVHPPSLAHKRGTTHMRVSLKKRLAMLCAWRYSFAQGQLPPFAATRWFRCQRVSAGITNE